MVLGIMSTRANYGTHGWSLDSDMYLTGVPIPSPNKISAHARNMGRLFLRLYEHFLNASSEKSWFGSVAHTRK